MKNLNNRIAISRWTRPLPTVEVDGLTFAFPDDFLVARYDAWVFYRNQIGRMDGAKAVDLIVVAPHTAAAFLVEVKDYRVDPVTQRRRARTKPTELSDEMAAKVLHSLGGILAARTRADDNGERTIAVATCSAPVLRVVLHLEQGDGSKLFPRIVDPANLRIKLRKLLRFVDPHAVVVSRQAMGNLPWRVI